MTPLPGSPIVPAVTVPLATSVKETPASPSTTAGLGRYDVTDPRIVGTGSEFPGPIRGQLSPGGVLFSSLNGADKVVASVFAETAQRPMTVVATPGGGRRAFQVLRGGDLVVTGHADGQLIDTQTDLTRSLKGPPIVGDPSAVADPSGAVHVFGRDARGGLSEYLFNPKTGLWTTLTLAPMPASSGPAATNPTAFVDPRLGAEAVVTSSNGRLVLFDPRGAATDLSAQPGWGGLPVYSTPGVAVSGGRVRVVATDQTGALVRAVWPSGGGRVSAERLILPGGLQVFQDVKAIAAGGVTHAFAVDDAGRLIHVTFGPGGVRAEDVTAAGRATAQGYSAYQKPYAGRVLSDVSALAAPDGTLYVYGTNGRDLVEFRQAPGARWTIRDLTNA
ncbi:MAG: hypothetical protein LC745_13035, partial [Planctomycetia bacterium]|nr:hypothetical protein [Planctomycetia bacterium]